MWKDCGVILLIDNNNNNNIIIVVSQIYNNNPDIETAGWQANTQAETVCTK